MTALKDDRREKRHADICEAAYGLLAQHGYGGTSMLRVAKAAKASNETLYRWYGDKDGLFKAMVRDNAGETRQMLNTALQGSDNPRMVLERVAPVFLRMLLGERAILLNRAAAADPTGALGATISAGGRNEIMPLLDRLMQRLCEGRECEPKEAAGWFISLLVGDLQIKRVINERAALSGEEIDSRCAAALRAFDRLTGG